MSVSKTIASITGLILLSLPVQANQLDRDVNSLPITLQTLLESSGRDNVINLVQFGALNHAELRQSGVGNETSLMQMGSSNHADIIQYGQDNEVEILQAGTDNQANISQLGNDNLVQLNQLGSANFSIEQIADGAAITITQY